MAELKSIGEVAEILGTTTRTLRYYEQLGLVSSSRVSVTAQRRYGETEIARLRQIRELQTLLGLDLDEIGTHMASYDRLEALKAEYTAGVSAARRSEILVEGFGILEGLRAQVSDRLGHLTAFAGELDARLARYRSAWEAAPVAAEAT
jgi:DNA-binding transcriptional MerR regulator